MEWLNNLMVLLSPYMLYINFVFYLSIMVYLVCDIRKAYRLRKGKDIIIQPQLTLFTDNGDKIHVISVNEEQGRYVLYHSRNKGLQLVTNREFMALKSGG